MHCWWEHKLVKLLWKTFYANVYINIGDTHKPYDMDKHVDSRLIHNGPKQETTQVTINKKTDKK